MWKLTLAFLCSTAMAADCVGNNKLPMFGCDDTYKPSAADQEALNKIEKMGFTPEQAFTAALNQGWSAFHKGEADLAVKRFNQAWLVHRDNYKVLWAFGAWAGLKGSWDDAVRFFRKADTAKDPKDFAFASDFGRTLAYAGANKKDPKLFAEAEKQFQASFDLNPKYALNFGQWAQLELFRRRYAESWKKVKQAEELDPKAVPDGLLKDLTAKMKRP